MNKRKLLPGRINVGGVAEAVLKSIDPDLLERASSRIADIKTSELPKQQVQG